MLMSETATRGVLRNFAKFTGKSLRQCLFFNKVAGRLASVMSKNGFPNKYQCRIDKCS